jgi:N-acetylglucosamine-6-phosphate deacetylase
MEIGVPGVLGIHIEGPYLNEERKGVHDVTKLRWLDEDALGLLTGLNGGRTLVTLAPERTSPQVIRKLADAGVIVSAGHTNGTYEEIKDALSQGLTGFTHLFNAMSQLTGREPGAVGAALDDADSWCGIIVDGHHVDPVVLRIALRSKRPDRFMLVTDAMPSVGAPKKSFTLQGRQISVADNKAVDEHGRLAGSDIDMASAVRNAISMLGVELEQSLRMASRYPAEFLRLGQEIGRIAPGYRANLALLDAQVECGRDLDRWKRIVRLKPDSSSLQRDPDLDLAIATARIEARVVPLEIRCVRELVAGLRQPRVPDRGPRAADRGDVAAMREHGVAIRRHAHAAELRR